MNQEPRKVAIACQGGGSHTAFTAGVLEELFTNWPDGYELTGISGTSGGAFNALAAWYGLVTADRERAAELVVGIWEDLKATGITDQMVNNWVTTLARARTSGFPIPQISPYDIPGPEPGKEQIREILEAHIDFEAIPGYCAYKAPELVVGTVNINAGDFETFVNEEVTVEAVLASAAVPSLYRAVKINGHYHWDGLFSQNPPVSDLLHQPPERKPEELWIIQINDQTQEGEPTDLVEIANRRNELSGNLSLNQELSHIRQVSDWVETGKLPSEEFVQPDIRRIELEEGYSAASKIDRDPAFIDELIEAGRRDAATFLADHPAQ